jgi:hypothetical protein
MKWMGAAGAAICGALIGIIFQSFGFGISHWEFWAIGMPICFVQGYLWGMLTHE